MTFLQAIVIGIIQGLTEFLPISSTAHIRVVPALLGWDDPGAAFTAVIQWGTLLAAVVYFFPDIVRLTRAVLSEMRDRKFCQSHDAKMAYMIGLGTVPVVVLGLSFRKHIETSLRSLYVISAAAIALALVLMAAEGVHRWREKTLRKQKELDSLGWWDAVFVGFAQALALIPGASRSGVTITGGLFLGMTRETAARFSFLLSLPAVFGAGVLELYKERHRLLASQGDISNLVIATIVSGLIGYATIAFLLGYLKRHSTYLFIIYRLALGATLLLLLSTGLLVDDPPAKQPGPGTQAAVSTSRRGPEVRRAPPQADWRSVFAPGL
jgi:undecaprenyl-diphosphatase